MTIDDFLQSNTYLAEKAEMPITREVIEMMQEEKPFHGISVVLGHFIALNSVALFEALWRGGAGIAICTPFMSDGTRELVRELHDHNFQILPVEEAVFAGDYFIDVAGMLGRLRTPKGSVEVTKSGDYIYERLPCPCMSIDRSRLKYLEDFLGTGESFIRGWDHFHPDDPLDGKRIVLFGYGKVGKGVAFYGRKAGAHVTVVDINSGALTKAQRDGFDIVDPQNKSQLQSVLREADIVIGATGIPGTVGKTVPQSWLLSNRPFFVNIGIDEFGDQIPEEEVLGGRDVPINFHLSSPTQNHKIDPVQAAEMLALRELVMNPGKYGPGLYPLPQEIDDWVIKKWIAHWPGEDLSGIAEEIKLSELE